MRETGTNRGIITHHGTTHVTGSAVGDHATVNVRPGHQQSGEPAAEPPATWDVGVVAILAEEMAAVVDALDLRDHEGVSRAHRFHVGTVDGFKDPLDVVATRALGPGQRSAMAALGSLHRHFAPKVFALVGIGGAIHAEVAVDDVIVATRVVYYDLRKETPEGILYRGEEREAPATVVHAVNAFFTDHGEPATLRSLSPDRQERPFRALHGPIGSGEAVIADAGSAIRGYLSTFDYKVLAVDMEAGGLSQFCHETSSASGDHPGWLVVRGISDHADKAKDDDHHRSAAINAAHTLRLLMPYIGRTIAGA